MEPKKLALFAEVWLIGRSTGEVYGMQQRWVKRAGSQQGPAVNNVGVVRHMNSHAALQALCTYVMLPLRNVLLAMCLARTPLLQS
jgi:hypothetical protein